MSASDPSPAAEAADLARMLPVPPGRDLPAGRRHTLKEHLMAEMQADRAGGRPAPTARFPAPPRPGRPSSIPVPRPRVAVAFVTAAAVVAGAVSASLALLAGPGGHATGPGGRLTGTGGQATAAQLLAKIANVAARSPAPHVRDSQFAYIQSWEAFQGCVVTTTGKRMTCTMGRPHERQIWQSVSNLCRAGLLIEQGQRIPLTEQGPGCPDRGSLNDPTYRLLQSLPTDPYALLRLIYRVERGHGQTPDQEAFTTIGDLLNETIAPPRVSAALYRAAALIPGVRVVPHAVDAVGRAGIAVAFTYSSTRWEWIFNRTTLRWLGQRDISTVTGKVIGESAVLARAFVDRAGQLPGRG